MRASILLACAALLLAGCTAPQPVQGPEEGGDGEGVEGTLRVTSPAFGNGTAIPREFTCQGQNTSPPLQWNGTPGNATHLAMIVDDPDATRGTFTHWTWWNLPANVSYLGDGQNLTRLGAVEGANGGGSPGYVGPCPPSGTHRYIFRLYALAGPLELTRGAPVDEVRAAVKTHALATGSLTGLYAQTST